MRRAALLDFFDDALFSLSTALLSFATAAPFADGAFAIVAAVLPSAGGFATARLVSTPASLATEAAAVGRAGSGAGVDCPVPVATTVATAVAFNAMSDICFGVTDTAA